MDSRPLRGLRVLDFGQGVAGPYCGQLLADHGAEVIKVEPRRGDWSRHMGRQDEHGMSGTFLAVNRSKRSICLDLKQERSAAVGRELALRADVVVESFRPGVMERFGLGYEQLHPANPGLVYTSVTGFGRSGPNVAMPAGDSTMQAYGGLMSIVGESGGPPLRVGNVVSDMVAGTNAFAGVCLALAARQRDGTGTRVSTSLLDSMVAFQAPPLSEYLLTGALPEASGNQHPLIAPSGAFAVCDGYITLTVLDHQWPRFCERLELTHLRDDSRFHTSSDRQRNRRALNAEIAPVFASLTAAEALETLRRLDILCSPIHTYADLVRDPQVQHNQLIDWTRQGAPMVRNPVRIGETDDDPAHTSPPKIGEHTRGVLAEDLGWDDAAIEEFLREEPLGVPR